MNKYKKLFDYAKLVFIILIIGILPSIYIDGQINSSSATEAEVKNTNGANERIVVSSSEQEEDDNEPITQTFEGGNLNITINATTFHPGQSIGINMTASKATLNETFTWYIESPGNEKIFNSINEGYQLKLERGDLDNDGVDEFVVGSYDGWIRIFNITNTINEEDSINIGRNAFGITIGDVHNDSNLDLVVSGDDGEINVISYDGSTYTINSTIPAPDRELITQWQKDYWQGATSFVYHRYGLVVGDVHNDSITDLVVGDSIGLIHVYTWNKTSHNFALNWTSTETEDLPISNRMNHDAYSIAVGKIRNPTSEITEPEIFVGADPKQDANRAGVHIFRWNATASTFNETRMRMRKSTGGTQVEWLNQNYRINSMTIANITGKDYLNLVATFSSDSYSLAVLADDIGTPEDDDFFFDHGTKFDWYSTTGTYGSPIDFLVLDLDNDNKSEILMSTSGSVEGGATLIWFDLDTFVTPLSVMDVLDTLGGLAYALEANLTTDAYQILMAVGNGSLFLLNATIDGDDLVLDHTFGGLGSIEDTLYSDPTSKEIQTPLDWKEIVGIPHNTQGEFIFVNDSTGYGPSYYFYDPVNETIPVFYLRRNGTASYLWDRTSRDASGTPTLFSDVTSFKWQVDVLNNTRNDTGSVTYVSINGTLPEVPLLLGTFKFVLLVTDASGTRSYEVAFTIEDDIVYNTSDVRLWIKRGLEYSTTVRLQNTTQNVTITNITTYYAPNYLPYDLNETFFSPGDEIIFITSFFYGSNESVVVDTKYSGIEATGVYEWLSFDNETLTWLVDGFDDESPPDPIISELTNNTLYDDDLSDDNQTHWVYYNDSLINPNNTDIALRFQIPVKSIYGEANGTITLQWDYGSSLHDSLINFENLTVFYKLISPSNDPITDPSHYPEDNQLYLGEKTLKSFTLIPRPYYNESLDISQNITLNIIEEVNVSLLVNRTWGIVNSSLPLKFTPGAIHLNMTTIMNGTQTNIFTLWLPINYTYTYYGYVDPNTQKGNYTFSLIWEDAKRANTTLSTYQLFNISLKISGTLIVPIESVKFPSTITQGEVFKMNFSVKLNETGELIKDLNLQGIIDNDPSQGYAIIIDEAGNYYVYVNILAPGNHNISVRIKATNEELLVRSFTVLAPPTPEPEEEVPFIAYLIAVGGLVFAVIAWSFGILRVLTKKQQKLS